MLTLQPRTRVAGIVAELEQLFVDRQTLVHRLEGLTPCRGGPEGRHALSSRGVLSLELERIVAQQTRLLGELAVLHPPSGRVED